MTPPTRTWLVILVLVIVVPIQHWRCRREVARLNARAERDYAAALQAWDAGDQRSPPPRPPDLWIVA